MTRYADGAAFVPGIARIEAQSGRGSDVEPGHLCRTDLDAVLAADGELVSGPARQPAMGAA